IAAFFERRLEQDIELMTNLAARAANATAVELLRISTEEMVRLYRDERDLYRSVAEILPLMEQTPEVEEGLSRAVGMVAMLLRAHPAITAGRDPDLLATVIVHSLRSALFRIVANTPEKLDDPELTAILVGGTLGFLGLPPDAA